MEKIYIGLGNVNATITEQGLVVECFQVISEFGFETGFVDVLEGFTSKTEKIETEFGYEWNAIIPFNTVFIAQSGEYKESFVSPVEPFESGNNNTRTKSCKILLDKYLDVYYTTFKDEISTKWILTNLSFQAIVDEVYLEQCSDKTRLTINKVIRELESWVTPSIIIQTEITLDGWNFTIKFNGVQTPVGFINLNSWFNIHDTYYYVSPVSDVLKVGEFLNLRGDVSVVCIEHFPDAQHISAPYVKVREYNGKERTGGTFNNYCFPVITSEGKMYSDGISNGNIIIAHINRNKRYSVYNKMFVAVRNLPQQSKDLISYHKLLLNKTNNQLELNQDWN